MCQIYPISMHFKGRILGHAGPHKIGSSTKAFGWCVPKYSGMLWCRDGINGLAYHPQEHMVPATVFCLFA